jgi:hypothetical protein
LSGIFLFFCQGELSAKWYALIASLKKSMLLGLIFTSCCILSGIMAILTSTSLVDAVLFTLTLKRMFWVAGFPGGHWYSFVLSVDVNMSRVLGRVVGDMYTGVLGVCPALMVRLTWANLVLGRLRSKYKNTILICRMITCNGPARLTQLLQVKQKVTLLTPKRWLRRLHPFSGVFHT